MATPYQDRKLNPPAQYPENKPYWEAAAKGQLLVKKCNACGEFHHYPRSLCPFCFSDKTEWVQAKGTGVVYTYSVLRRGSPTPYAIGYVTLDEGPTMMTNIVDCDLDCIKIGQRVTVVFKPTGEAGGNTPPMPMFKPV